MPGSDFFDWLEAEQEYRIEMTKNVKCGLRRIGL